MKSQKQPQIKIIFAPPNVGKSALIKNIYKELISNKMYSLKGEDYVTHPFTFLPDPLTDILLKKPKYLIVDEYMFISKKFPDLFRNILLAFPEIQIFCVQTWTPDDFYKQNDELIEVYLRDFALSALNTNGVWINLPWSDKIPKTSNRMVESGSMLWKHFGQEIYCETFRYNDNTPNKLPNEFNVRNIFNRTLKENWIQKHKSIIHFVDVEKSRNWDTIPQKFPGTEDEFHREYPFTFKAEENNKKINEIVNDKNYELFNKQFIYIIRNSELFPKLKGKYIYLDNTCVWEIVTDLIIDPASSKDTLFLEIQIIGNYGINTIKFSLPIIYDKYFTENNLVTVERVWEVILDKIANYVFLQKSKDSKVSHIIPRLCRDTGNILIETEEEKDAEVDFYFSSCNHLQEIVDNYKEVTGEEDYKIFKEFFIAKINRPQDITFNRRKIILNDFLVFEIISPIRSDMKKSNETFSFVYKSVDTGKIEKISFPLSGLYQNYIKKCQRPINLEHIRDAILYIIGGHFFYKYKESRKFNSDIFGDLIHTKIDSSGNIIVKFTKLED